MNKDDDARLLQEGEYRDEKRRMSGSKNDTKGTCENIPGTFELTRNGRHLGFSTTIPEGVNTPMGSRPRGW